MGKLIQTYSVTTDSSNPIIIDNFPNKFKLSINNLDPNIDDYVGSIKVLQTGVYGKYTRAVVSLLNILILTVNRLFPPGMTVSLYDGKITGFVSNVD